MLKIRNTSIDKSAPNLSRSGRRRRGGLLTMEMILVLPILFTVLMAVFEFSILFFARSSVVQACRAAARRASLGVTDQSEIEEVVRRVLSPNLQYNHTVYYIPAERAGEITTVGLTQGDCATLGNVVYMGNRDCRQALWNSVVTGVAGSGA